jgi:hypothetical protein
VTALDHEVAARVARHGPLHLDEVLDLALYDPERGFYGSGAGAAGRGRDFLMPSDPPTAIVLRLAKSMPSTTVSGTSMASDG